MVPSSAWMNSLAEEIHICAKKRPVTWRGWGGVEGGHNGDNK